MSEFSHILLTRFNVRMQWGYAFRGCDPDWLAERFGLFDRYCFPSIAAQTNTNFTWLVFFDSETPTAFRNRLARYETFEPFRPVFVQEFNRDVFRETLDRFGFLNRPFLVTSRVDNDDALACDYIDRVQKAFAGQERTFINFPKGLILRKGALFQGYDIHSHFVSLIKKSDEPLTVYVDHTRIKEYGAVAQIDNRPAWLEVRHFGRLSDKGVCPSWRPVRRMEVAHLFPSITEFQGVSWLSDTARCTSERMGQLLRRINRRFRSLVQRHKTLPTSAS